MTWATGGVRHLTDAHIDVIDNAYVRAMREASAKLRDRHRAERGLHPFTRPRALIEIPFMQTVPTIYTWRDVINAVAKRYNLDPSVLTDPDAPGMRKAKNVRARYVAMWILHKRGSSYPAIGQRLGGRDHSTVINGIRRIEAMASSEERAFVEALCPAVIVDEEEANNG